MSNRTFKILVPTDFSRFSQYAFDAAIEIAQIHKGEVHLYHSANIPDDWEDLPAETRYKDFFNKKIAIRAGNTLKEWQKRALEKGIPCDYHYTGGAYIQNIEEVLQKVEIDLIIMGSFGKSKITAGLGSQTIKTIRKFDIPVLVLKTDLSSAQFKKVGFATGLNLEDQQAFHSFLRLIKPFPIQEIHIISIDTGSWFSQPGILMKEALKDFAAIAKEYNVNTHFYRDYSVHAGVTHFVDEFKLDLVAINNHISSPIKRFFQGSNVEAIVMETDIPVLSIN